MKSTIKVKLLQVGYTFIYLLITDTVTLGKKFNTVLEDKNSQRFTLISTKK